MPEPRVHLVSYPKSGRTWLRYFLSRYLERAHGLAFDLDLCAQRPPGVRFTHDYFDAQQDQPGAPRLIQREAYLAGPLVVLTRDPRDVAISYYHHKRYRQREDVGSLRAFLVSSRYGLERQAAFVLQLLDLHAAHPGPKLALSYEAIRRDPADHLGRLAGFVYGELDPEALGHALQESSFTRMQAHERDLPPSAREQRLGRRRGTEHDPRALKVRSGRVGGWRRELDLVTRAAIRLLPRTRRLIARRARSEWNHF